MIRTGFVILCTILIACGSRKEKEQEDESGFSFQSFSKKFREITPPYQLSDTGFLKNADTATIRSEGFAAFISDSLKTAWFGKNSKPKYIAMVSMKPSDKTQLFFIKAIQGNKKIALVCAFDDQRFSAVFPFLIPDNDATTSQLSYIDRSFVITKTVIQRKQGITTGEGKEVYDYDATAKAFSLILTNPLNATNEVINPIDTLPRTHKFAGDYVKSKRNYISVRDGRSSSQLLVFIHIDQKNGSCTGELKGEILMTSATTGVYRQAGDPCGMSFRFSPSSVIVKEDQGCGSHRGLECVFNGTYPKKKETEPKGSTKKSAK